jgi:hypothetical protein
VAVGTDDRSYGFVTSSPDGATWTRRVELSQPGLNAVAYGHGRVVAVGYYGAILSRESPQPSPAREADDGGAYARARRRPVSIPVDRHDS